MDYVDACPAVIVAHIEASIGNAQPFFWPDGGPASTWPDAACVSSMVAAFAPGSGAGSSDEMLRAFFRNAHSRRAAHDAETVALIADAAGRVVPERTWAQSYFELLMIYGVDLRDHLSGRFVEDRDVENYRFSPWFQYQIYLAHGGDTEALGWIREALQQERLATRISPVLRSLHEMNVPGWKTIVADYRSDARQERMPSGGGGFMLLQWAQQLLDGQADLLDPTPPVLDPVVRRKPAVPVTGPPQPQRR